MDYFWAKFVLGIDMNVTANQLNKIEVLFCTFCWQYFLTKNHLAPMLPFQQIP
jgi:hypothetical protein